MTAVYPLPAAKLRVKLEAEAIDAVQQSQWIGDENARKHTEVYAERLNATAGNLPQLLSEVNEESLSRSYRFLKKQVQDRLDKLISTQETGKDEIDRVASIRSSSFLLGEISKMGF